MQPLAGGFCATLWGIMGGLDYFTKALLLPRSTQEKGPCCLCRCHGKGAFTWSDFRKNAPWRQALWSKQAWRNWSEHSASVLFTLDYFTPWLIALDLMHVKYLGHDQTVYGSVLTLLCYNILSGSPTDNIKQVWSDIQAVYAQHSVPYRFRYLKRTSMFVRKAPQVTWESGGGQVPGLAVIFDLAKILQPQDLCAQANIVVFEAELGSRRIAGSAQRRLSFSPRCSQKV